MLDAVAFGCVASGVRQTARTQAGGSPLCRAARGDRLGRPQTRALHRSATASVVSLPCVCAAPPSSVGKLARPRRARASGAAWQRVL